MCTRWRPCSCGAPDLYHLNDWNNSGGVSRIPKTKTFICIHIHITYRQPQCNFVLFFCTPSTYPPTKRFDIQVGSPEYPRLCITALPAKQILDGCKNSHYASNFAVSGLPEYCPNFHFPPSSNRCHRRDIPSSSLFLLLPIFLLCLLLLWTPLSPSMPSLTPSPSSKP